jgi:hypothetical protein
VLVHVVRACGGHAWPQNLQPHPGLDSNSEPL